MEISPSTFAKLSAISYELANSIANTESHKLSRESSDAIHKKYLGNEYDQIYSAESGTQFYCCYHPKENAHGLGLITFYLKNDTIIICLKGTDITTIGDVLTDIDLRDDVRLTEFWLGKNIEARDYTIHSGFLYYGISGYAALTRILDINQLRNTIPIPSKIDDFISQFVFYRGIDGGTVSAKNMSPDKTKIVKSIKNIYITGHSLGGAAASLLAFSWNMQKSVGWNGNTTAYTFGAPPLGNAKFIELFNNRARPACNKRYLNHYDPVPLLLNSDMAGEYSIFSDATFDSSLQFIQTALLEVTSIIPALIITNSFRFSAAGGLNKFLGINILFGSLYSIGFGPLFPSSFYQPEYGVCLDGNSSDALENHRIDRYIENLSSSRKTEIRTLSSNSVAAGERIEKWMEMDRLTNEFLKSHFPVEIKICTKGSRYSKAR